MKNCFACVENPLLAVFPNAPTFEEPFDIALIEPARIAALELIPNIVLLIKPCDKKF